MNNSNDVEDDKGVDNDDNDIDDYINDVDGDAEYGIWMCFTGWWAGKGAWAAVRKAEFASTSAPT